MSDKKIDNYVGDVVASINVIIKLAELGNGNAMGRLGRAYRDGKGVEKDLDKAAEWMRKAADKDVDWAKNELFDILWRIGTPESYEEMISVVTEFADKGDGNAMGRLGRAYRDGKGVEKDLNKAAEWMRKAADKNVGWAKNELFDLTNGNDKFVNKGGEEEYVLFDVSHYSLLSSAIALKYVRHPKQKSILFVIRKNKMSNLISDLLKNEIFDYIVEYNPWQYKDLENVERIKESLLDYFDKRLDEIKCDLSNTKVYSGGDLYVSFGVYLYLKSKNFTLIELAQNQLNAKSRLDATYRLKYSSKEYSLVQIESGVIDGKSPVVEHIIFHPKSKYDDIHTLKATYEKTDLVLSLSNIYPTDKNKMKKCFGLDIVDNAQNTQLILFNSSGHSRYHSNLKIDELPLLYQSLVDYYGQRDLITVLKGHPEDSTDISGYISNSILLNNLPIELIVFCNDIKIKKAISIDTSAGLKLVSLGLVENNIVASIDFYTLFDKMHVIRYISEMIKNLEYNITQDVIPDSFLKNYLKIKYPEIAERYNSKNYSNGIQICTNIISLSKYMTIKIGKLTKEEIALSRYENMAHLEMSLIVNSSNEIGTKYNDYIISFISRDLGVLQRICKISYLHKMDASCVTVISKKNRHFDL